MALHLHLVIGVMNKLSMYKESVMPVDNPLNTQQSLESLGITNVNNVYWNLSTPSLVEGPSGGERRACSSRSTGCPHRSHTGRAPNDKFIVRSDPAQTKSGGGK